MVSDGPYRTVEATTKQPFPLKVANTGLNMQLVILGIIYSASLLHYDFSLIILMTSNGHCVVKKDFKNYHKSTGKLHCLACL